MIEIDFSKYVEGTKHVGQFRALGAGRLMKIQEASTLGQSDERSQVKAGIMLIDTLVGLAIDGESKELLLDVPQDKFDDFIKEVLNGSTGVSKISESVSEA